MIQSITKWLYRSVLLYLLILNALIFGACTLHPTDKESDSLRGAPSPNMRSSMNEERKSASDDASAAISDMPIEEILNRLATAQKTQPFHARIKLLHLMGTSPQYSQLPEHNSEYMIEYWQDGQGNFQRADLIGFSSLQTKVINCYNGLCSEYEPQTHRHLIYGESHTISKMHRDTGAYYPSSFGSALIFKLQSAVIEEHQILHDTSHIAGRDTVGIVITSLDFSGPFEKVTLWIDPERWLILATEPDGGPGITSTVYVDEMKYIDYNPTFPSDFWSVPSDVQATSSCQWDKGDMKFSTPTAIDEAQAILDVPMLTSNQVPETYLLDSVTVTRCADLSEMSVWTTYYHSEDGWAYIGRMVIGQIHYPVQIPNTGEIIHVRGNEGRLIDSQEGEHMLIWLENGQRFMIRGTTGQGGLTVESLFEIADSLE